MTKSFSSKKHWCEYSTCTHSRLVFMDHQRWYLKHTPRDACSQFLLFNGRLIWIPWWWYVCILFWFFFFFFSPLRIHGGITKLWGWCFYIAIFNNLHRVTHSLQALLTWCLPQEGAWRAHAAFGIGDLVGTGRSFPYKVLPLLPVDLFCRMQRDQMWSMETNERFCKSTVRHRVFSDWSSQLGQINK